MYRVFAVLVIAATVAGCDDAVPATRWLTVDAQPPAGSARIIFYRPKSLVLWSKEAGIDVNGQPACGLSSGDAFIYDSAPGDLAIVAKYWEALPAPPPINLHAQANHTYYVRVIAEPGGDIRFAAAALGGLPPDDERTFSMAFVCTPYLWR